MRYIYVTVLWKPYLIEGITELINRTFERGTISQKIFSSLVYSHNNPQHGRNKFTSLIQVSSQIFKKAHTIWYFDSDMRKERRRTDVLPSAATAKSRLSRTAGVGMK